MFGFLKNDASGKDLLELICLVSAKSWEEKKQGR